MYEYLRGEVIAKTGGALVFDVGGVGYRLSCSETTLAQLPQGGPAKVMVHQVVRDDRHELYGFSQPSERYLFRLLLGVSGVGPAAALGLLSTFEPAVLASHIAAGDLAHLTRVKGIGKRTAERIVVELRDKMRKEGGAVASATAPAAGVRADAVLALCSLGLPRVEAEQRVAKVKGDGLGLEELVREALR